MSRSVPPSRHPRRSYTGSDTLIIDLSDENASSIHDSDADDASQTGATGEEEDASDGGDDKEMCDLFKTHIWLKDSTNTFAAQLVLGTISTTAGFLNGIREAFVSENEDRKEEVMAKGSVKSVQILFWNLGSLSLLGLKRPAAIGSNSTDTTFRWLRYRLDNAFQQHREEQYGEQLLCFATVLFENDAL